jgi:23S rRNA (adenine2503-C2)-methyltransferase
MTDLPRSLREELEDSFRVHGLCLEKEVVAEDGARKFLLRTEESHPVESVCLPASDGATGCLSVASGCPLSCAFCASGRFYNGALRGGEIVDQYLLMRALGAELTGIVLMGMGEPLLNWAATRAFLITLRDACGVGARRITVSTVGIPAGMEALGKEFPQVKLAVSLHAPRDDLRRRLIPYAKTVSLAALMEACRRHVDLTGGRRITFEYVLLSGVNDGPAEARGVAALLGGLPAWVNLIPGNPFPGSPFVRPSEEAVAAFRETLCKHFRGEVTVRRSLGVTAGAACGQLGLQA